MLKVAAKKVDIFKGLEQDQFDELLSWFEKRKYGENENIFEEEAGPARESGIMPAEHRKTNRLADTGLVNVVGKHRFRIGLGTE